MDELHEARARQTLQRVIEPLEHIFAHNLTAGSDEEIGEGIHDVMKLFEGKTEAFCLVVLCGTLVYFLTVTGKFTPEYNRREPDGT